MKHTAINLFTFLSAGLIFFSSAGSLFSQEEDKSTMDIYFGVNSYYSSFSSESDYVIMPEFLLSLSGENVRGGFSYTGYMHSPVYDSESVRKRIDLNQAGLFLQGRDLGGFEITCQADYTWGDRDYSSIQGLLGLGYSSDIWKLNGFYSKSKADYSFESTDISLVSSAFGGQLVFHYNDKLDVKGEGRRDSFDYSKSDYTFSSNLLRLGFESKLKYINVLFGGSYGYDSDEYRFPGADAGVSLTLFDNIIIKLSYSFIYYISPGDDDHPYTPVDYMSSSYSTYVFRKIEKTGDSFAVNSLRLSVSFHF